MKLTAFVVALAIAGSSLAHGQDPTPPSPPAGAPQAKTPGVTKRQMNQQRRIKQGVRSGELTRKEARKLEKKEKMIQEEKREAKADGKVTRRERAEIRRDQKKVSRDIYRQKHDAQKRK